MGFTYPRIPLVSPGEAVASRQINALSRAINARLRSGLPDSTYRIHFYFLNLWRQVRNPDADGNLFPANSEWLEFYSNIKPETGDEWPLAGPGDPEGANLANPFMAFIYGNPGLVSESQRLAAVQLWLQGAPKTAEECWVLGQIQRGAVDPSTGGQHAPAFEAAQAYYGVQSTPAHGKSYGGYLPGPEFLGDCGDGTEDRPPSRNFKVFFTPVKAGESVIEFPGTCPDVAGHVGFIARTPFSFYIFLVGGGVVRLPRKDWIEGPYTEGGYLSKTDGEHLTRCLNLYVKDYRGSESTQRPGLDKAETNIQDIAFDFQRFFSGQYFLSPNKGSVVDGNLVAVYPTFSLAADSSAGTSLNFAGGGTAHAYAAGFVLGGLFARAEGLKADVEIEVLNGTTVLETVILSSSSDDGMNGQNGLAATSSMRWFENATTPTLSFRLKSDLSLASGGKLEIVCTEQQAYKPEIHDAYLVLRLSSTRADAGVTEVDGAGWLLENSPELSDNYFSLGMIYNGVAGELPAEDGIETRSVTWNPVYESARRFTRDSIRVLNRKALMGYSVEGGKSVLWFNRYALGLRNDQLDLLEGIGPSVEAVNTVEAYVPYVVRGSGSVTYAGATYSDGDTFTGTLQSSFSATGAAQVFEWTAIRHSPPPRGKTNQWLMFSQFKGYQNSDSSIWKEDSYSDYWSLSNRCLVRSEEIIPLENADLLQHFQGSPALINFLIAPEAPSSYNYANGVNGRSFGEIPQADFYKSCRVYEPDPEIESAIAVPGTDTVKITFKTRFHHCAEAPASIIGDVATWDINALAAEPYRTMENGIRQYLVKQALGTNAAVKVGDHASFSRLDFEPDAPWGAVYPHFFFTKLMEEVASDIPTDNDTLESSTDTLAAVDPLLRAEWYLRATCEGWIDGITSAAAGCKLNGSSLLFDYKFETLCFHGFGGQWLSFMPQSVRPDKPQGFGPEPNTLFYAELFNDLAKCWNLLYRARLMLPMKIECRQASGVATNTTSVDWPSGATCGGDQRAIKFGFTAPDPGVGDYGDWGDCGEITALTAGAFASDALCSGADYNFTSQKLISEYRVTFLSEEMANAVPPELLDMVNQKNTGFFGYYRFSQVSGKAVITDAANAQACSPGFVENPPPWFVDGATYYKFEVQIVDAPLSCGLFSSGTLDAGMMPTGDFYACRNGTFFANNGATVVKTISPAGDSFAAFIEVPVV